MMKRFLVLGGLLFLGALLVRFVFIPTLHPGSLAGRENQIQLPRLDDLGIPLAAAPETASPKPLPRTQRMQPSSGSSDMKRLVPPAEELRRLKNEGAVLY